MTFTKLGTIATIAGAIAISGVLATQASASSMGSVGFAGIWTETDSGANPISNTLSFSLLNTLHTDGIFTGYEAVSVKSLDLVSTGINTTAATSMTFYAIDTSDFDGLAWKTYENQSGDLITFDLHLDATWMRTYDLADGDVNYEQGVNSGGVFEYTGTYNLPDGSTLAGRGQLNGSSAGNARTFEITQAAVVPLPAAGLLLITAFGGLAATRRLKSA